MSNIEFIGMEKDGSGIWFDSSTGETYTSGEPPTEEEFMELLYRHPNASEYFDSLEARKGLDCE